MDKDLTSTVAGGAAGLGLLATVRWELIPMGELAKVFVAIGLIVIGCLMYRQPPKKEQ